MPANSFDNFFEIENFSNINKIIQLNNEINELDYEIKQKQSNLIKNDISSIFKILELKSEIEKKKLKINILQK